MAELAIEDEFVAFGTNIDGRFPAEKDEGEDIAVLQDRVSPPHAT